MQFPRQKRRSDPDERILPLTNVVFLLLIFFMLVGRLASPTPFEIEPPDSVSETPVRGQGIEIQITADGRLALDGTVLPSDEFKAAVAERLREGRTTPVRLKADGAVAATQVVDAMHILRDAGVEDLALVTRAADTATDRSR